MRDGGGDKEKWMGSIAVLKVEMSGLAVGVSSKTVPGFRAIQWMVAFAGMEKMVLESVDPRVWFWLYSV